MPSTPPPTIEETVAQFGLSDPEDAAREIADLVEAVFGPFEPEAATVWRLMDEEELTPEQSAELFSEAAEAENPLDVLGLQSVARARLNALMRTRWAARQAQAAGCPASLSSVEWQTLNAHAQLMVREGLLHLASFDADLVGPGAQAKFRLDTVIDGLAEIFARYTGYAGHQSALPHAERSYFVQFVRQILSPFSDITELEPGAISKRWKRFKCAHGIEADLGD